MTFSTMLMAHMTTPGFGEREKTWLKRLSSNSTARGCEAVLVFNGEDNRPQKYRVTIEPMNEWADEVVA